MDRARAAQAACALIPACRLAAPALPRARAWGGSSCGWRAARAFRAARRGGGIGGGRAGAADRAIHMVDLDRITLNAALRGAVAVGRSRRTPDARSTCG
jgi:hypothetical protein